jgi:hypothetical protein
VFGQQRRPYLRFRLVSPQGQATISVSRPRKTGAIEDGDIVEVPGTWRPGKFCKEVYNKTTGEIVKGGSSPTRVIQWIILIAFLLGFIAFFVWGALAFWSNP